MTREELIKLASEVEQRSVPNLYDAIHTLGNEGFVEAKGVVEQFLTYPKAEVRYIALNVLAFHWMCADHRSTCERFIASESDSDCRRMGVAGLGALLQGTRDSYALALLLKIFEDEHEEWDVRDTAYAQILYILGKPASAQPSADRRLDYKKDINWAWVDEARKVVRSTPP